MDMKIRETLKTLNYPNISKREILFYYLLTRFVKKNLLFLIMKKNIRLFREIQNNRSFFYYFSIFFKILAYYFKRRNKFVSKNISFSSCKMIDLMKHNINIFIYCRLIKYQYNNIECDSLNIKKAHNYSEEFKTLNLCNNLINLIIYNNPHYHLLKRNTVQKVNKSKVKEQYITLFKLRTCLTLFRINKKKNMNYKLIFFKACVYNFSYFLKLLIEKIKSYLLKHESFFSLAVLSRSLFPS
uniref:Uncharacterized protein n=1 Tax=Amorphochlora amoebiformis TaxID=1561963 RepID=A0A0H5BLN4_9EUKA|nr:hypothetical protein [Amorphochlora amoebiformis]